MSGARATGVAHDAAGPGAGAATRRQRLRESTAPAHAALEAALDLPARLDDRATVVAVLGGFRGFFASLEPALDAALGDDIMRGRHRLADLDADLSLLGFDRAAIDGVPRCGAASRPRTRAEALGALYVVEGARLGGRVIGRHLRRSVWAPDGFSRFWSAEPPDERLGRDLSALLDAEPDEDRLVGGAAETFRMLQVFLQERGIATPPAPGVA